MLYYYVSIAYTIINLLLAGIIVVKSPKNLLNRFYAFCVGCLVVYGLGMDLLSEGVLRGDLFVRLSEFLFCLLPFFFLHFVVIFLQRYDILKSKAVVIAIYSAGLLSYLMVATGMVGQTGTEKLTSSGFIYYITWMSIFFSIGVTLLYSMVKGFAERKVKSNLLLSGFAVLLIVLPGPLTHSIAQVLTIGGAEWYGVTSAIALLVTVYLLFRHKIMVTVYDSIKAALIVMNDLFIMTDEKFQVEVANGSLTGTLGITEADLFGRSLNDFIEPKDYIPMYLHYVQKNKMKEGRFDAEMKDSNGKILTVNFSFSPVFENEQLVGFVGMGKDITEQKVLEQHQREAQKLESISTLASGIAYDFTKLLSVIMGYARLIDLAKTDPETLSNSSDEIKKSVQKGAELVRQISAFARQTADNLESVQVKNLLDDISVWIKQTIPINIKTSVQVADGLPAIKADKSVFLQALQNLCLNARDAMMPDGGTLEITASVTFAEELSHRFESATAKKYIGIYVKDTGRGMSKEVKERIFEPFFTTKESTQAAGLGLAVVYGVVRSHGGHIDVESELGKGTTFNMFLPVG
ncbi:MAG: PAS domain S-box protein [Ignavibacteriae bacterium]|nr:PAS domain S-box protein [Ignavibacteriota bacterium]